jgi:hypothetical protein
MSSYKLPSIYVPFKIYHYYPPSLSKNNMPFFAGAQGITIENSTLTDVGRDYIHYGGGKRGNMQAGVIDNNGIAIELPMVLQIFTMNLPKPRRSNRWIAA